MQLHDILVTVGCIYITCIWYTFYLLKWNLIHKFFNWVWDFNIFFSYTHQINYVPSLTRVKNFYMFHIFNPVHKGALVSIEPSVSQYSVYCFKTIHEAIICMHTCFIRQSSNCILYIILTSLYFISLLYTL